MQYRLRPAAALWAAGRCCSAVTGSSVCESVDMLLKTREKRANVDGLCVFEGPVCGVLCV